MNLEPTSREQWEEYLRPVFEEHAPKLANRYEGPERQKQILIELGETMVESGLFEAPIIESIKCDHVYSHEEYITLQTTYSPVIALPEEQRANLLEGIRKALKQIPNNNGQIQLSNVCGFQMATKK
jgi:hypothetical protein